MHCNMPIKEILMHILIIPSKLGIAGMCFIVAYRKSVNSQKL